MNYEEALEHRAEVKRNPKPKMMSMEMKKAENGGVVVTHRMSGMSMEKEPMHAFGAEEGHMLAKHIEKHMAIKMPGIKMSETHGEQSQEPATEPDED